MFREIIPNDSPVKNILPNGLPLYAEDVITDSGPTKFLSVPGIFNDGFSPCDRMLSCLTTSDSIDDNVFAKKFDYKGRNNSVSETLENKPFQLENFVLEPWETTCLSSRTCFDVYCSQDMLITAVMTFLNLYDSCHHEFLTENNSWNCIVYKSMESVSFTITFFGSEKESERFVLQYQRMDGPCHLSQDLFRSLLNHCRTLPYLQVDEDTCSLKRERSASGQAAFDRLSAARNKPLHNVPAITSNEETAAVKGLTTWLSTDDMTSLVRGVQCVAAILIQQSTMHPLCHTLEQPLCHAVKRIRHEPSDQPCPLSPDLLRLVAVE